MMKKLNDKGSSIITGIVIVMIIFIILGTSLAIATSYQQRAVNEHARKQAYLNAIAIVDAIAGELNDTDSEQFLPPDDGSSKIIENVVLPTTMIDSQNGNKEVTSSTGTITGEIIYDRIENNEIDKTAIYIRINSTYATQEEFIQLKLRKYAGQWRKVSYSDDSGNEVNPDAL